MIGELTRGEADRYPDPAPDAQTGRRQPQLTTRAEVAQLVEHRPEEAGVVSSNLTLGTTWWAGGQNGRKWLSW